MQRITGKIVKDFRLRKCWTQMEAAKRLNVSLRTLKALENEDGKRDFLPLTLAKIAMAMESIEKAA